MNEHCISPMVIFSHGKCVKCGGALVVVDMETNFMELAPDGSPVSEETMIKCEAVCRDCGTRTPMLRDGLKYIPDNEYNRLQKYFDYLEHQRLVEEEMESLKPTKDNPLCINFKKQG